MRGPFLPGGVALACLLTLGGLGAQEPTPWHVGVFLWHRSPNDLKALDGIRTALTISGRPHRLTVVEADSDQVRAKAVLGELRASKVDLIVAMGTQAALICKDLETTTPVVFTAVTNPVDSGVVPDWAGSGSNLAGNSNWIDPQTLLDVFAMAVPGLEQLGVLRSETTGVVSAAEVSAMRELLDAPGAPAIALREEWVRGVADFDVAVDRLAGAGVQAIWIPIDFLIYENIERVAAAAARHEIPLVSSSLRGVTEAAVAGLVVDYEMLGERAVLLALDILEKRSAPGDLPIGRMVGYEVVVNLRAARRLGYEVPLPLLAVADLILDDGEER